MPDATPHVCGNCEGTGPDTCLNNPDRPKPGAAAILRAPWTPEQVHALNAFQSGSGMHPFTCGRDHGGQHIALIARTDGWHCSEPSCDYRQNWALTFMADPSTWPGTRRLRGLLEHVGIDAASREPAPVPGPDPALQDRVAAALYDTYGQQDTDRSRRIAAAVLAELAPELAAVGRLAVATGRAARAEVRRVELADALGLQAQRGMLGWPALIDAVQTLRALKDDHRARTEQAEAALARVRDLATSTRDNNVSGTSDYSIGRHDLAVQLLALLDGPCADPYTDADGHTWRCERDPGHDGPHRAAPDAEHHKEWPAAPAEGSPR